MRIMRIMRITRITRNGMPITGTVAAVFVTLLLSAPGCVNMAYRKPSLKPVPYRIDPPVREWFNVYHIDITGGERSRQHVGYVSREIAGEDWTYHVWDLEGRRLGFIFKDLRAYRFTTTPDVEGRPVIVHEAVGSSSLETGTQRILGFRGGSTDLERVQEVRVPGQ